MKLVLSKDVTGVNRETGESRLHAKAGDVVTVILTNPKYFWCFNDKGPLSHLEFPVHLTQVERIINENDKSDNDEESFSEPVLDDIERSIQLITEITE